MKEREFKKILVEYLNGNGLTQAKFADKIGVKAGHVGDWARGKSKPGYDMLKRLVIAFYETPIEYWLGLDENY